MELSLSPDVAFIQQTPQVQRRRQVTMFMTVCSTCGRRLNIPVGHLGATVQCCHCGRNFLAVTPDRVPRDCDPLIARANAILAILE